MVRQSSVPSRFDEAYVQPSTELEMRYGWVEVTFWDGSFGNLEPDIHISFSQLWTQNNRGTLFVFLLMHQEYKTLENAS